MKYSQLIGVAAALALIGVCYMPWCFIPSVNITLSGVNGYVSTDLYLGKPLTLYSFLVPVMILFFLLPKIWAKRTNVFLGLIVLGYSLYNFLLFSTCRDGICPEKKAGIYLLLVTAFIIQLMTFFPKIKLPEEK